MRVKLSHASACKRRAFKGCIVGEPAQLLLSSLSLDVFACTLCGPRKMSVPSPGTILGACCASWHHVNIYVGVSLRRRGNGAASG